MTAPLRLRLADCDAWAPGAFLASLSDAERTRAGRYRRVLDRDRFVVRRGLLRRLLGAALGLPPADVPLGSAAQGKPTLVGAVAPRPVAFNLSHSGALSLIGIDPTAGEGGPAPIGVDLEAVDARPRTLADLLHVARRIAPGEAESLALLPEGAAAAAFHRLWTCKEACLKCLGTGIGGGGPGIDAVVRVAPADSGGLETWRAGEIAWSVRCFEPCPGHLAAVARPAGTAPVPGPGELDWLRPHDGEGRGAGR